MDKEIKIVEKYYGEINHCPLFSDNNKDDMIQSLELLNYKFLSYKKNEYLLHCGDALESFGLVVFGRIKVMIDDLEGNTAIMAEVTAGKTFGESLCFLKRDHSGIYICAAEDTGVIWLSPKKLFIGIHSNQVKALERRFVEMLATRTLLMNNRIQILSKLSLREKIITFLTFSKRHAKDNHLDISLSREEMAIYFGTNRSALSRELSNMKKDGLIDYSKNHFIIKF